MVAYVIVDTKIENTDEYEKYKALARPLVEKHGGIYRARGGDLTIIEDDLWRPTRIVLLEFPDAASAKGFLESEEYAPVAAIRHANAKCTSIIVEGV